MATRPGLRGRALLAGLLLVLLTGCGGSAIDDTNAYDRQVLGGGKALTVVAPEDRKPAAVVTGPTSTAPAP